MQCVRNTKYFFNFTRHITFAFKFVLPRYLANSLQQDLVWYWLSEKQAQSVFRFVLCFTYILNIVPVNIEQCKWTFHHHRGCKHFLAQFPYQWFSCRCTVTRWVSHVEHEHLTLPEHLILVPEISGVHVAQFAVFCLVSCRLLFGLSICLFFFRLDIVLSVLLPFTTSNYPPLLSSNFTCLYQNLLWFRP